MKIRVLSALALICTFGSSAHSEIIEILQEGLRFSPSEVEAQPGDTLRFTWTGGTHTVTTGNGCTAAPIDGFFFDEPLTAKNQQVDLVIPADFLGELRFICDIGQHCAAGMSGLARVSSIIEIQQVGLDFSPSQVTAQPGQTLRFIHNSGTHSVVSGFNCSQASVNGLEFNEPLTSSNPVVDIQIPDDFSGELGYFCDVGQHCVFGMFGSITVESPAVPGDFNGDGQVDGADLGLLLAAFGTENEDFNLNSDPIVDGADLGLFLALFTG